MEQGKQTDDVQKDIAFKLLVIADHLKTIRGMLAFFVWLTLIVLALGACNVILLL